MSHPEDESNHALLARQIEEHWQEALLLAERILVAASERLEWKDDAARERYLASVPLLAVPIQQQIANAASLLQQANQRDFDAIHDSLRRMIEEIRKRNSRPAREGPSAQ